MDSVVDLVGNRDRDLLDSLRCVGRDGRVVQLGFLGGLEPLAASNPMLDLPTGAQFSFYVSVFVLGTRGLPVVRAAVGRHFRGGGLSSVPAPTAISVRSNPSDAETVPILFRPQYCGAMRSRG